MYHPNPTFVDRDYRIGGMRKRKDSHDGSPVGDTNILFVPDSSADPSASGVDALMGMIDEAGAPHALTRGRARGETSPAG